MCRGRDADLRRFRQFHGAIGGMEIFGQRIPPETTSRAEALPA
jgi:hypothetical protein